MSKASDRVTRKMNRKVDLSNSWSRDPDLHEKLVLDLAREIEECVTPNAPCITWASQMAAQDYFNEHGFVATLDHMNALRNARG